MRARPPTRTRAHHTRACTCSHICTLAGVEEREGTGHRVVFTGSFDKGLCGLNNLSSMCCAAEARALIERNMKEAQTTGEQRFVRGSYMPAAGPPKPQQKPPRRLSFVRTSYQAQKNNSRNREHDDPGKVMPVPLDPVKEEFGSYGGAVPPV